MKSRTKYLSAAAAVMLCGAAFAASDDALITFSTTGDTYADGKSVVDGEWYALCWSEKNDGFAGFAADGSPLGSDDKVLAKLNVAEGGRCPTTTVQVRKSYVSGGSFFLYLLDTRDVNGVPAQSASDLTANGVNSTVEVISGATVEGGTVCTASGVAEAEKFEATDTASLNIGDPEIYSFTFNDQDQAVIKVRNMSPYLQYNVRAGSDISSIRDLAASPLKGDAEGKNYFVIEKGDSKFFKVVRQPYNNK